MSYEYEVEDLYGNPEFEEFDNPYGEELIPYAIEANPNPKAARACRKAAKYRRQGMDASSAMSQAWSEVGGRSNPMDNPLEGSPFLLVALAAGIGSWLYKRSRGVYPWEAGGLFSKQRLLRAPIRKQIGAAVLMPVRERETEIIVTSTGESARKVAMPKVY